MRKLSFLGFLKQYLPTLSGTDSLNLRKLMCLSETVPRLREPLFLYALEADKVPVMERSAGVDSCFSVWCRTYTKLGMRDMLEADAPELPEGFRKVWRSYLTVTRRIQNDDHTKALMLAKVRRLQQEKHLTNYRVYTDLKLNPGNTNAWLKHGDSRKVSLEAARRVLHYAQSYPRK